MNKFKISAVLILVFILGIWIGNMGEESQSSADGSSVQTVWTCSMHPNIKLPDKGQCPICFMDLIPLNSDGSTGETVELKLSPEAEKLAEIQTAKVIRDAAYAEISVIGKLDYDESKIRTISAWAGGRIERLYVDYTGMPVQEKDHLMEIYSPELIAAQEEYLTILRSSSESGIKAAGEKLRLLGITSEQINRLRREKTISETVTVYAPASGIVIAKNANEGDYIKTGTELFKVADLSRLWLMLDIFESDLPFVYLGQQIEFRVQGGTQDTYTGKVAFISPILNPKSRSVKVRVNIENSALLLKPDMFVHAKIESRLDANGKTIQSELAGKWICPMHPDDVHENPGECTICGMEVIPSEKVEGLAGLSVNPEVEDPLLIPTTAVLRTGTRSVVYTRTEKNGNSIFQMKKIDLGPKVGSSYIVLDGLAEGELVVSHGTFKIDSEMQISALPSMMNDVNKDGDEKSQRSYKELTNEEIEKLLPDYIDLQQTLADDDFDNSVHYYKKLLHTGVKLEIEFIEVKSINDLRENFYLISGLMLSNSDKLTSEQELNEAYCPMAFDNSGASWIQIGEVIDNPYFGASMLRCGVIKNKLRMDNGE